MSTTNRTGTLETIAVQVVTLLGPLHRRLADGGALELLAELGLRFPPELLSDAGFAGAVDECTAAGVELAGAVRRLVAASDSDDLPEVALASADLVRLIAKLRTSLEALATALAEAAGALGFSPDEIEAFVADLPRRLVDHSVVVYLEGNLPALAALLDLAGVLDRTEEQVGSTDPVRPPFTRVRLHLDRLPKLVTSPAEVAVELYGWGTPGFDGDDLFTRVATVLSRMGFPAVHDREHVPPVLDLVFAEARLAAEAPEPGVALAPRASFGEQFTQQNTDGLAASATVRLRGPDGAELVFTPDGELRFTAPAQSNAEGELQLRVDFEAPDDADPVLLLGQQGGPRLLVRRAWLALGGALTWDPANGAASGRPGLAAAIASGELVLAAPAGDGFLGSVIPAESGAPFAVELGLRRSGLHLRGSGGLDISLPVVRRIGPVTLEQVHLAVRVAGPRLDTFVTASLAVELGPVLVSIGGLGVRCGFRSTPEGGNAGPVQVDVGVVAPDALGIVLDAGAVTGGGFLDLDSDTGRYGGVLQLALADVSVDAIGLLETRLPGQAGGYSLIVAINAEFPPVQVGFGFALTGAGGLVALNRRVDVDALRQRLASGTAGRILNPADPIRNAPSLLADLGTVFPVQPGVHVVGPTVRLIWAGLVHFDVGIFIELPGPARVVILGSARAEISRGQQRYLQIRLDVQGVVDLAAGTAAFDAVLIDSKLMEVFDLTGGAAFRLSWGAQPYAVLTVGGFHPAYNPEPLVFPGSLTRVAMVHGTPTDRLYLRFEGYFAITTNTLQFGAAVEAIINAGNFNIQGILRFDTLIRFQPFRFQIEIRASVRVRYKSRRLAGLTFKGSLSGPGPVVLRGRVCIEILFFDICFEETFTIGSSVPPAVTPVASALDVFLAELTPANLRASEATDRYVALRPAAPPNPGLPLVSPLGQLTWVQHRAPLGLLLQRIGGAPLSRPESVVVAGPMLTGPELEWFAPGSFVDLTDAEALNRKAFERLTGGARFGDPGTDDGPSATRTVSVRQIRPPAPETTKPGLSFPGWFAEAVLVRTGGTVPAAAVPAITVGEENWTVSDPLGGAATTGLSSAQAHQLAALRGGVAAAHADRVTGLSF